MEPMSKDLTVAPPTASGPLPDPKSQTFEFGENTFAFANETVWNYVGGRVQPEATAGAARPRAYSRRCFVVSRAAVQFWKFARFEAALPPLEETVLARRIRQIASRPVWRTELPPDQRIVIPGYRNLREASAAHAGVFQAHMGLGWPIYFRVGNFPIILPMSGATKTTVNEMLVENLRQKQLTVLWLYNFPRLDINHAVVVYAAEPVGPRYRYKVYDPNYTDEPKILEFDPVMRQFLFQPTFYYRGGSVTARPVYLSHVK